MLRHLEVAHALGVWIEDVTIPGLIIVDLGGPDVLNSYDHILEVCRRVKNVSVCVEV